MSTRYYRPELDVVRFVAFLAVFLHHLLPPGPAQTAYGTVQVALSFGLPLFFTLSAYLITTLLLKERDRTATVDLLRFYKRRALRIWPLYFGALIVGVSGPLLHRHLKQEGEWYLAALFMLGNVVTWQATRVGHLWSISVEEQFYVFWPTVMKRCSRSQLLVAAIVVVLISNGVLFWLGSIHADTGWRVWWNSFVQMDFFGAGILLALHDHGRTLQKLPLATRLVGLVAILAACLSAVRFLGIKGEGLPARGPVSLCLGYALVAMSCAAVIYLVQGMQQWPRWAVYFGKVSYGLYVFHPLLLTATKRLAPLSLVLQIAVALAGTMALAWLSYTFYEAPFLKLKERFEVVKSRPIEAA